MSAVLFGPPDPIVLRPTITTGRITGEVVTVPPVVPTFTEPCPDCGGTGWLCDVHGVGNCRECYSNDCSLSGCRTCHLPGGCGGTGIVQRIWRAEEQWRAQPEFKVGDEWHVPDAPTPDVMKFIGRTEADYETAYDKRLAVVAWCEPTVLPVMDENSRPREHDAHYITVHPFNGAWEWGWANGGTFQRWLGVEPWAAGLSPGCVVVLPGEPHPLDRPIVEMDIPIDSMPDLDERVPLALVPGLNNVELAQ